MRTTNHIQLVNPTNIHVEDGQFRNLDMECHVTWKSDVVQILSQHTTSGYLPTFHEDWTKIWKSGWTDIWIGFVICIGVSSRKWYDHKIVPRNAACCFSR